MEYYNIEIRKRDKEISFLKIIINIMFIYSLTIGYFFFKHIN